MTETNAITVSIGGKEYLDRPGSCGKPNHMWDLRVLDEDGTELPVDTPGLLQCRGIGLMKEYWNNRQATLDNIDNDGWLDTGDIARIDEEGYLYIMVSTTACQRILSLGCVLTPLALCLGCVLTPPAL